MKLSSRKSVRCTWIQLDPMMKYGHLARTGSVRCKTSVSSGCRACFPTITLIMMNGRNTYLVPLLVYPFHSNQSSCTYAGILGEECEFTREYSGVVCGLKFKEKAKVFPCNVSQVSILAMVTHGLTHGTAICVCSPRSESCQPPVSSALFMRPQRTVTSWIQIFMIRSRYGQWLIVLAQTL